MLIRKALPEDLPRVMEIFSYARAFMTAQGNPDQWAARQWPPEELIRQDIAEGKSYVCEEDGRVIGTFYYEEGEEIEPTYRTVYDGAWHQEGPYGVVHRIAGDGSRRGIGTFCLAWALDRSPHLRIDTHADNIPMQGLLKKLGFVRCGTIYVDEDGEASPRLAYEKVSEEGRPV